MMIVGRVDAVAYVVEVHVRTDIVLADLVKDRLGSLGVNS